MKNVTALILLHRERSPAPYRVPIHHEVTAASTTPGITCHSIEQLSLLYKQPSQSDNTAAPTFLHCPITPRRPPLASPAPSLCTHSPGQPTPHQLPPSLLPRHALYTSSVLPIHLHQGVKPPHPPPSGRLAAPSTPTRPSSHLHPPSQLHRSRPSPSLAWPGR